MWHRKMYYARQETWQTIYDKYLGILDADTVKQVEIKGKIKKEYLRRNKKNTREKIV